MARQQFDPLHNFDFTKIGYVEKAASFPGNITSYGANVIVKLSIGESTIAYTELSELQPGDYNSFNVDIYDAIKSLGITTGRYELSVQPFINLEHRQTALSIQSGPANPNIPGTVLTRGNLRRISNSRTEILFKTPSPLFRSLDGTLMQQIEGTLSSLQTSSATAEVAPHGRMLEFGLLIDGTIYTVLNIAQFEQVDSRTAVVKLDRPLEASVENGAEIRVVMPFGTAYVNDIDITTQEPEETGNPLKPADFTTRAGMYNIESTNFLNRNQLLYPEGGHTTASLNVLLNKALSGSGYASAELGIDYRRYENFVHFGSALERLENFKYKLEKLEHYSESIRVLSASNASESFYNQQNIRLYTSRSNTVLQSFDHYENYLYYNSSSNDTSSLGLYSASTWPKTNAEYPYTLQKVSSAESVHWFYSQSLKALDYDVNNLDSLEKIIPVHVRVDEQNANFLTFVHMIGQHFDDVWSYVDHINKLYDRDERLNIGISKDIVYEALGSLGWTGQSGYAIDELWSYYNGIPFSGSTFDTQATPGKNPTEDITKEIWNRTLNNLPYLLKTRGTERGVRGLLATYGMPSTLLEVSEYGGPSKEQSALTFKKQFTYNRSLQFNTSSLGSIPFGRMSATYTRGGANTGIDSHEIRIKPTLFTPKSASVIMHAHTRWGVTIEPHPSAANAASSMSNHAEIAFYIRTGSAGGSEASCSTGYLPLYDGDWWNIEIGRVDGNNINNTSDPQTYQLKCAKADDYGNGKITHMASASCLALTGQQFWVGFASATEPDEILLGQSQSGAARSFQYAFGAYNAGGQARPQGFSGSMQEYRAWHHTDVSTAAVLESHAFENHTRNPRSIEGNSYTASYSDLIVRYPLGTDNNTPATSPGSQVSSSHPRFEVQNPWHASATADDTMFTFVKDFTNTSADWNNEEEHYYIAMPDIIGNRTISDKIRIDTSATYSGQLSRFSSSLSSSIELAGPDSPIVGVNFSPTREIDIDMASQIGAASFDDFIGNPRDTYRGQYNELREIREHYWEKYPNRPTFSAYLNSIRYFDKSLFRQVDMMLPGRAIKQVGVEIRPTILERNTIAQKSESFSNDSYMARIHEYETDNQRAAANIKLVSDDTMASSSIALSETAQDSDFGTLNPTVIMGQPFEDNFNYAGMPNRASSFVVENNDYFRVGENTSDAVPTVAFGRTSILNKRVEIFTDANGTPISRSIVPTEGQDYRARALQRLYFDGCKIGSTAGSIGGVIAYRGTDNSLTYPGIIPGVLAAIEVVETNPNTVAVQSNPTTIALPELTVR